MVRDIALLSSCKAASITVTAAKPPPSAITAALISQRTSYAP